jgi:hypothetical protein
MENNTLEVENLFSKNRKYWVQYYGKQVFDGKNYHSFLVLQSIRNYWQQVESGVNFSDQVLEEYLDELI